MSRHYTPGPWCIDFSDDWELAIIGQRPGANRFGVPDMWDVCKIQHDEDFPEYEANARLISAAPELLAALQELMPEHVSLTNLKIRDRMVVPCDVEIGALRRAAAAIAKAVGE